jgi:hypothetical protein
MDSLTIKKTTNWIKQEESEVRANKEILNYQDYSSQFSSKINHDIHNQSITIIPQKKSSVDSSKEELKNQSDVILIQQKNLMNLN